MNVCGSNKIIFDAFLALGENKGYDDGRLLTLTRPGKFYGQVNGSWGLLALAAFHENLTDLQRRNFITFRYAKMKYYTSHKYHTVFRVQIQTTHLDCEKLVFPFASRCTEVTSQAIHFHIWAAVNHSG